jgi:hypothetical protein
VVVSDILDEYTQPAKPSGLEVIDTSASETVDGDDSATITIDWTENSTFNSTTDKEWREAGTNNGWGTEWGGGKPYKIPESFNPTLDQGERYEIRVENFYYQRRHGSKDTQIRSGWTPTVEQTTPLVEPTSLSVSNITNDSADLSWSTGHDYGQTRAYLRRTTDEDGMSFDRSNNDRIELGRVDPTLEFGTGDFTFASRVTFDSITGNMTILELSKYSHGALFRPDGNNNDMDVYVDGSSFKPDVSWSSGDTYDIIVTRSSGTVEVFVNGTSYGTKSMSGSVDILQESYIGASVHTSDQVFPGTIHHVQLYDRALTSSERQSVRGGGVASDPVGHWSLDQVQLDRTPDISGHANHGTVNGATLTNDKSALTFENSNSYADTPDLGNTGGFSISCEFKKSGTNTNYIADGREGSDNWWFLTNYNGEDINFHNDIVYSGVDMTTWTHVIAANDSNGAELYVDGDQKDTGSGETAALDTVRFGLRYSNSGPLNGQIRNVQIHDHRLSADEARRVSRGEVVTNGLLAYYPFSETEGGTTPDLYNGNDATLGSDVTKYGSGPEIHGFGQTGLTSSATTPLFDGREYEAFVQAETEHNFARDY